MKIYNNLQNAWRQYWCLRGEIADMSKNRRIREHSFLHNGEKRVYFLNEREANQRISELLKSDKPCMIARHGGTEIKVAASYDFENTAKFVDELCFNSGFFPNDHDLIKDWAELYLESCKNLDLLCEWNFRFGRFNEVEHLFGKYSPGAEIANHITVMTPFFLRMPWTSALAGKRILVVHPFSTSIERQYEKRKKLFPDPEFLPDFGNLDTLCAVQTIVGTTDPRFGNWFDAYHFMRDEISRRDFDIALIGCGCYGLVLAADVKKMGRKAIHLGGRLQLLFGIRGHRWDSNQTWITKGLYNEHWTRPLPEETPKQAKGMEEGAYW